LKGLHFSSISTSTAELDASWAVYGRGLIRFPGSWMAFVVEWPDAGRTQAAESIDPFIGIDALQSNVTSVWLYLFSSNRIEIFLVLPENESHQQK
jgi:hypothetical protein